MSRFDLVLLFIFALIVAILGADLWLIVNGHEQFSGGVWTFATAVCTGEVVTFSLYRIAKGRGFPQSIKGKHQIINDLENEEEESK